MGDASGASEYTQQLPESFAEDLAKLSPAQQRAYATRMATTPPRTAVDCARMLGIGINTFTKHWADVKTRLGRDPLLVWKQKGIIGRSAGEDFERLRSVTNDTLIKLTEMRMEAALRAINQEKLEKASAKELGALVRDLSGVRQIQKGEPTQILQVNQRENLKRLFPMAVKELARRGYSIELGAEGMKVVEQVDVTPQPEAEA